MTFHRLDTTPGVSFDALASTDGTYTVVTLEATADTRRLLGMGVSKKHPNDEWNPQVGVDVALSRALEDVAAQIRKEAL